MYWRGAEQIYIECRLLGESVCTRMEGREWLLSRVRSPWLFHMLLCAALCSCCC